MNSGQYHQRPQLHGLPLNFQYPDGTGNSGQATSSHRMLSCDGLPRSQPQSAQHFMTATPVSSSNLLRTNYDLVNPMPLAMSSAQLWPHQTLHAPSLEDPNISDYYGYSPALTSNDNNGAWLRDMDSGVPRWMPENVRLFSDTTNLMMENYEPSPYMIDPKESNLQNMSRPNLTYPPLEEPRDDFSRLSISHSPVPRTKIEEEAFRSGSLPYDKQPAFLGSNDSSEDGGGNSSREMTAVDLDEQGADEPYAKLIYRALMSAPNHSMVLQEIYQWFRDNTGKGTADGKGWMNSIRHNLSMNAAFKKTERKLQGDDTKKSTEWVLEPFAIKDGVQSTTRYRKGTSSSKKIPRAGDLNHHPAPSRQSSGRKGGISASKTKFQRQRTKEERERMSSDPRAGLTLGGGVRSASRLGIDSVRRAQFERQTRAHISNDRRQRSPLTPPAGDMTSPAPYFSAFPKVEQEPMDLPFEDMYALEDCQGVYLDGGPLFSNDGHGQGHEGGGSFHQHAAAAVAGGSGLAMSSSRL